MLEEGFVIVPVLRQGLGARARDPTHLPLGFRQRILDRQAGCSSVLGLGPGHFRDRFPIQEPGLDRGIDRQNESDETNEGKDILAEQTPMPGWFEGVGSLGEARRRHRTPFVRRRGTSPEVLPCRPGSAPYVSTENQCKSILAIGSDGT